MVAEVPPPVRVPTAATVSLVTGRITFVHASPVFPFRTTQPSACLQTSSVKEMVVGATDVKLALNLWERLASRTGIEPVSPP